MKFYKSSAVCVVVFSASAFAASMVQTATLKDLQTVGSTTKKQKHQQYDLVINTNSNEYVCRTKLGKSMKPTEFVVGTSLQFKLDGQKGEATNFAGNRVKCDIVRVAGQPYP